MGQLRTSPLAFALLVAAQLVDATETPGSDEPERYGSEGEAHRTENLFSPDYQLVDCDAREFGAVTDEMRNVTRQCRYREMGHAGQRVICRAIGVPAVHWFDEEEGRSDADYWRGGECAGQEKWDGARERCPPIRPRDAEIARAACLDEQHGNLPAEEREAHINCVQACLFTIAAACDGQWADAPRPGDGKNETRDAVVQAGLDQLMSHCGIQVEQPGEAPLLLLGVLEGFYVVVIGLFAGGYHYWLRPKSQRAFDEAVENGEVEAADTDSQLKMSRRAKKWMAKNPAIQEWFFWIDPYHPHNVKELGMDASMYLAHMRFAARYWLFQLCTIGVVTTVVYQMGHAERAEEQGKDWTEKMWTLMASSYSHLPGRYRRIVPFAALWHTISMVYFTSQRNKLMGQIKLAAGFAEVRSTSTLWFEQVPPELTQQQISDWFDAECPGKVKEVQVALDVHDLGKNIRGQRRLINKINKLNKQVIESRLQQDEDGGVNDLDFAKTSEAINLSMQQLDELQEAEPACRNPRCKQATCTDQACRNPEHGFSGSGNVFVTFHKEEDALQFRMGHKLGAHHGQGTAVNVHDWDCTQAPMPAELYWENMGMTKAQRLISSAIGFVLTGLVFGVFIGMVCVAVFFIGWDYFIILYKLDPVPWIQVKLEEWQNFFPGGTVTFYVIGVCALVFGVLLFEEHMAHIVAHFAGFERAVTKSLTQRKSRNHCWHLVRILPKSVSSCEQAPTSTRPTCSISSSTCCCPRLRSTTSPSTGSRPTRRSSTPWTCGACST